MTYYDPIVRLREILRERVEDYQNGKLKGDDAPKGLKNLRNADGNWSDKSKGPGYHCDNCGCDRYTKCKCSKKSVAVSQEQDEPASNEETTE